MKEITEVGKAAVKQDSSGHFIPFDDFVIERKGETLRTTFRSKGVAVAYMESGAVRDGEGITIRGVGGRLPVVLSD